MMGRRWRYYSRKQAGMMNQFLQFRLQRFQLAAGINSQTQAIGFSFKKPGGVDLNVGDSI